MHEQFIFGMDLAQGDNHFVQEWPNIPKEAFLYFPRENDIRSGAGDTFIRRIFEGQMQFEPFEERKLQELNIVLQQQHKNLLPWFNRANKLRFIQACKYDIKKSLKSISQNNDWRVKTFPVQRGTLVESFVQSGAIYICGRDHCFRPIIVIDIGRFDTNNSDIQKPEFLSKVLGIFFEFMISDMLVEGQVENYVMLLNLNSLNMFTIGGIAKKLLEFTNNMYRGRMFAAYILNTSSGISFFWKMAQSYLSENTVKKINFSDTAYSDKLFTHTHPSQIEQRFGGAMPNISAGFFPPRTYSYNYFLETERPENKLITEAQYLNFFRTGKLRERKVLKSLVESTSSVESAHRESSQVPEFKSHLFSPIKQDQQSIESVAGQFKTLTKPAFNPPVPPSSTLKQSQMSKGYSKKAPEHFVRIEDVQASEASNHRQSISHSRASSKVGVVRRKDSLESQMRMDLAYIQGNALQSHSQIVDIPVGNLTVYKVPCMVSFFQQTVYMNLKRAPTH